jgi:hypothetical protein
MCAPIPCVSAIDHTCGNHPMKQRFLHFYFLNELAHLLFLLCMGIWFAPYSSRWTNAAWLLGCYIAFCLAHIALVIIVLVIRRQFRESSRYVFSTSAKCQTEAVPDFRQFKIKARDGVEINVRVSVPQSGTGGAVSTPRRSRLHHHGERVPSPNRAKVMLVAAPLGQCGPKMFKPVFAHFGGIISRTPSVGMGECFACSGRRSSFASVTY